MEGGCLCGALRWSAEGALSLASHCHCSRCRKAHGSAYATYAAAPAAGFRRRGEIARFESSPGFFRCFCPRCGSSVPGDVSGDHVFVPLGGCDGDPGVRPAAHIFFASKAPWLDVADRLPRFDAYPPGVPAPALASPPLAASGGTPRGTCLCGAIAFAIEGPVQLARYCHCQRCRKARAAAHAANLLVAAEGLRFVRGGDALVSYKIPEAERFTQCFCGICGGKVPRVDPERALAVVPMGALDGDPGIRPSAHIFVASKAAWDEIADGLPQLAAYA